jgi:hypothetical protein
MLADSGASAVYIAEADAAGVSWSGSSGHGFVRVASGEPLELGRQGTINIKLAEALGMRVPGLKLECTEVKGIAQ